MAAASRNAQQADWQSTRVPKLSYRKAIPQEELEKINYAPREYVSPPKAVTRTVSSREAIDGSPVPNSSQAPPRKKSSILAGFFSKEPTISALAQVEADLTAKHGAATPHTVPHVSSRRMPDHVPKVNSRWDGIPETVKSREREEKQRKRLSQTGTLNSPQYILRSRSSDESIRDTYNGQQSQFRRGSDTASHTDSWQSRTDTSTGPQRHESFSSGSSSNASRDAKARQAASVKSQSLRSPSGNSLPEITSFFPHQQAQEANQSSHGQKSSRVPPSRTGTTRSDTTSIEAIPEHSSSPVPTPREKSPATPIYGDDRSGHRGEVPRGGNKKTHAHTKHVPIDAFLAGEARPVEFDDDDSDDSSTNTTFRTELPIRPPQAQQNERAKTNGAGAKQISKERDVRAGQMTRSEAASRGTQQPKFTKLAAPAISKNRIPKGLTAYK